MTELEQAQEEKIYQLEEEIERLKGLLGFTADAPLCLRLTGKEAALVGFLRRREAASKQQIMDAIYGAQPDGDEPEIKIVDVFVCKVRKKLLPYGMEIETIWGRGYRLSPEVKRKLDELIKGENALTEKTLAETA